MHTQLEGSLFLVVELMLAGLCPSNMSTIVEIIGSWILCTSVTSHNQNNT